MGLVLHVFLRMGSGKDYGNWKAFPTGGELRNENNSKTWLPLSLPVMEKKRIYMQNQGQCWHNNVFGH